MSTGALVSDPPIYRDTHYTGESIESAVSLYHIGTIASFSAAIRLCLLLLMCGPSLI